MRECVCVCVCNQLCKCSCFCTGINVLVIRLVCLCAIIAFYGNDKQTNKQIHKQTKADSDTNPKCRSMEGQSSKRATKQQQQQHRYQIALKINIMRDRSNTHLCAPSTQCNFRMPCIILMRIPVQKFINARIWKFMPCLFHVRITVKFQYFICNLLAACQYYFAIKI